MCPKRTDPLNPDPGVPLERQLQFLDSHRLTAIRKE